MSRGSGVGGSVLVPLLVPVLVVAVLAVLVVAGPMPVEWGGPAPAGAAPGDLDAGFSSDGKVTTDVGSVDAGRAVAINRDLTQAQSTLDSLTPEWEAAALKLDELR